MEATSVIFNQRDLYIPGQMTIADNESVTFYGNTVLDRYCSCSYFTNKYTKFFSCISMTGSTIVVADSLTCNSGRFDLSYQLKFII